VRRLLITVLVAVGLAVVVPTAGMAQDSGADDAGQITVIEVSGLLDDLIADFIDDSLAASARNGDLVLVLQVNSSDAVIDDDRLAELAERIAASPVPVGVWVGPSGSRATGKVAQLVSVAADIAVSPGSRLGDSGDLIIEPTLWSDENAARMADQTLNWEQVIEFGVVGCELIDVDELGRTLTAEDQQLRCASPTIGDYVVDLDEFGFQTRQVTEAEEIRLEPLTAVRFQGPDLLTQLLHSVASPAVTYLLLVIGISLLLFELYSVGVGIAGVLGAVSVALSGYGLGVLPFNWWALVVVLAAFVIYAADIQTGVPGPLTILGTVVLAVGTIGLFDGVSMSWIPILIGIVGTFVMMWFGMPLTVRGRFGTPRIDREALVGESGQVVESDADGLVVQVRDAPWRARAGSDLAAGDRIRVTGITDLIFDVEPVDAS